ncbi:RNA-binding protein 45 isoform X2 [Folsomia candida]|nr:RNA-binding protein 45 isoform X2 [Folsomia candida]
MHERGGRIMADKRRYYHDKEGANSTASDTSRHSAQRDDEPPNSRLFLLCGRNVTEEELRESFEQFGEIKELWIVKEKDSGQSRGIAYIKYSKTSEAAVAMEEMNGKFIGNNAKALKVMIASGREQGSKRETNETERLLRLFIIVSRQSSETEIRDHFSQFGDIEHCNIVKDRNTKESKGFGYVKYFRISHAAKAYEGCDRTYKPKFADPRPSKQEDRYSSAHGSTTGTYDMAEYPMEHHFQQPMMNHVHHNQHQHPHTITHMESPSRLTIIAHRSLNQDQLWRLCDFFPGLDYCNVRHDQKQCYATVVYNSAQAAAHAKEKLHGFEYPPGHRLIVRFDASDSSSRSGSGLLGTPQSGAVRYITGSGMNGSGGHSGAPSALGPPLVARGGANMTPDLAVLAETIAQATSMFNQAAGLTGAPISHSHSQSGESYDPSYCSVKLPSPQPLAPIDSPVLERLFVVCQPRPPPLYALKDVFGRFGNLIDIFMLSGKNHGYAKYATKGSADEARMVLHGQEVLGMRLKVLPAEPQEPKGSLSTSPSGGPVDPK